MGLVHSADLVGGAVVIFALFASRPRVGVRIFDWVGSRRKLRMVLAYAGDGITCGCRSLLEGVPMMFLLFEVMDYVPPPRPAPLGGVASC